MVKDLLLWELIYIFKATVLIFWCQKILKDQNAFWSSKTKPQLRIHRFLGLNKFLENHFRTSGLGQDKVLKVNISTYQEKAERPLQGY